MSKDPEADRIRRQIIERADALAKAQGLSQTRLATEMGASRQTVNRWFSAGDQLPNEANLIALARVLGTSVSYLFGETDDPRPAPDWHTGKGPGSADEAARDNAALLLRQALAALEGTKDE